MNLPNLSGDPGARAYAESIRTEVVQIFKERLDNPNDIIVLALKTLTLSRNWIALEDSCMARYGSDPETIIEQLEQMMA